MQSMKLSRHTKTRLLLSTSGMVIAIYVFLTIEKLPPILGLGSCLVLLLFIGSLCELIFPKMRKQLATLDAKLAKEHEEAIAKIRNISPQENKFSWKGLLLFILVLIIIAVFIVFPSIYFVYLWKSGEFNASVILLMTMMMIITLLFSALFAIVLIATIASWVKGARN